MAPAGKIIRVLHELDDHSDEITADWLGPARSEMSNEITAAAGKCQLPS
jgi:hypothetical protein